MGVEGIGAVCSATSHPMTSYSATITLRHTGRLCEFFLQLAPFPRKVADGSESFDMTAAYIFAHRSYRYQKLAIYVDRRATGDDDGDM